MEAPGESMPLITMLPVIDPVPQQFDQRADRDDRAAGEGVIPGERESSVTLLGERAVAGEALGGSDVKTLGIDGAAGAVQSDTVCNEAVEEAGLVARELEGAAVEGHCGCAIASRDLARA